MRQQTKIQLIIEYEAEEDDHSPNLEAKKEQISTLLFNALETKRQEGSLSIEGLVTNLVFVNSIETGKPYVAIWERL